MGDTAKQHENSKPWLGPHQWKRGQSGNPKGRPKGASLTGRLRAIVESERDGADVREALLEAGVKAALAGDFRFWQEIFNRLDGKVPDKSEFAGLAVGLRLVMPAPKIMGEETENA